VRPSDGEALALHRKYGSSSKVLDHCGTVAEVAKALCDAAKANGKDVDEGVVVTAALLHDIGRTRTQTVSHGLEGSELLRAEGVNVKVVDAVRRHVGAGISPEEARSLGLPDLDYIPRSLEERIVCFADKMVDGDTVRPFSVEVERFVRKGHDVPRLLALKDSLQRDIGADPETVALGKVKESH